MTIVTTSFFAGPAISPLSLFLAVVKISVQHFAFFSRLIFTVRLSTQADTYELSKNPAFNDFSIPISTLLNFNFNVHPHVFLPYFNLHFFLIRLTLA